MDLMVQIIEKGTKSRWGAHLIERWRQLWMRAPSDTDFMVTSTSPRRFTVCTSYIILPPSPPALHLSLLFLRPLFFSSLLFLFLHHMLAYNAKRIKNRKETKKRQHHAERESESSSDVMVQRWCLVPPPTAETGSRLCWWRRECAATQHTKQLKLKKKERNETRGEGKWNILWSQRVSVCVCGRLHYTRDLVALSPSGPPQFHPHSVFDMRQTRNYIFTPFW